MAFLDAPDILAKLESTPGRARMARIAARIRRGWALEDADLQFIQAAFASILGGADPRDALDLKRKGRHKMTMVESMRAAPLYALPVERLVHGGATVASARAAVARQEEVDIEIVRKSHGAHRAAAGVLLYMELIAAALPPKRARKGNRTV